MMLQSTTQPPSPPYMATPDVPSLARHGKRKALDAPDGNERLSKRLSLLNLERGGAKLYVPVESPRISPVEKSFPAPALPSLYGSQSLNAFPPGSLGVPAPAAPASPPTSNPMLSPATMSPEQPMPPIPEPAAASSSSAPVAAAAAVADDDMRVDNSKYKVYIYDLDDELSSDGDADGEGKLVFLPDIEKHLRDARSSALAVAASTKPIIPRPILPNKDGELAGMQLVLYHDPSSLSVPRERDSVRQAILDARARIRERQQEAQARYLEDEDNMADDESESPLATPVGRSYAASDDDPDAMDID